MIGELDEDFLFDEDGTSEKVPENLSDILTDLILKEIMKEEAEAVNQALRSLAE